MRFISSLLLVFCLAGCNRGSQNKDAVRQGIVDHLNALKFNLATMDVNITSVQFNGNRADATVSFSPKGAGAGQGMAMQYQLEQQGNKWVVVGRKDSGGASHGGAMPSPGAATPGTENPHAAAPAPGAANPHGGASMPSPEDLPPAGKKK